MTTVKRAIEHLSSIYKPSDHIAIAIWSIEDVINQAKENGIKITKKQAEKVIDFIDRKQDATLGISWVTVDCALDNLEGIMEHE